MKCKYTFKVVGKIKPTPIKNIVQDNCEYDFNIDKEGFLKRISLIVKIDESTELPSVIHKQTGKIKGNIRIPTPASEDVRARIRVIEGFLALFGVKEIDVSNLKLEWIPENEIEKEKLGMKSFERITVTSEDSTPPLPFSTDGGVTYGYLYRSCFKHTESKRGGGTKTISLLRAPAGDGVGRLPPPTVTGDIVYRSAARIQ